MTDKELIQALRYCGHFPHGCGKCPAYDDQNCIANTKCFAADLLEALLAEVDHLREVTKMVPQWVSVSERLPETEGQVLVTFTGKIQKRELAAICWQNMCPERAGFWKSSRSWRTRMLHTGVNFPNRPALRGWSECST